MAKASIHLARAVKGCFKHNDRSTKKEPGYLLPKEYRLQNEVDRSAAAAEQLLKDLYSEAKENYANERGQKLQAKSYVWEAVVNLNKEHTLEDVQRLTKEIEKETGFTAVQIAIHRDEGYINERGIVQYNLHAHITFFTLDRQSGKQLMRRDITPSQRKKLEQEIKEMYPNIGEKSLKEEVKKLKQERYKLFDRARLSKLQDLTANVLNMQRGKKGSKAVRLEHKQYREAKKQELAKIKDINEENRRIREILKELQAKREHYAFLEQKIAQLREEARAKELTIEELKKQLNEVETELKNALMTDYELKKENNALKYALKSSKMREISLKDENGSLLLELAEKNAEIEFLKEQLKEKEKIIKTITQQAKNKIIPELYVDFALKELNNEKRNNTRRVKQTNARLDVRELRSRIYQNIQSIRDRQTRDISSLLSRQSRVPKRKSSSNGKLQSIQASRRGKGRDRGSRRGRFWDNTMGLI